MDDVRERFVEHPEFASSETRPQIFADWQRAKAMIDSVSPDLIEAGWVGGSFVTGKLDPDDIDCMFLINGVAFKDLPSNTKRATIRQFNVKNWLRNKTDLRVETFILVRDAFANPWVKGGIREEALDYLSVRGGWDDWWLRVRSGSKDDPPILEDAEPVRGYLEVTWP